METTEQKCVRIVNGLVLVQICMLNISVIVANGTTALYKM